jgi:UTP--glucose-1-phosphate uridylyltransferase
LEASPKRFTKVVIPAAGLGTRLLPVTKETPKEMLPIAVRKGADILLKPMLQAVFEQLFSVGYRDFCFITGRGKRSIEDHFTPDWSFLEKVKHSVWRSDLESFFRELEASRLYFVNQAKRRGFGDAVLHSEEFVGKDPFMVHAGDDLVLSRDASHLTQLARIFSERGADAALLVEEVRDPKRYGVIVPEFLSPRVISVRSIVEKPEKPPSRLAVIAVYAFSPRIFDAIRSSKPDASGEVQLTSAIQALIEDGRRVLALKLRKGNTRIDIGNPESYIRSLTASLERSE